MVEIYKLQASFQEGRLANANSIPLSSNPFEDNELELKLSWSNGWESQNATRAKPIRNFAALENKSNLYKEGWEAYQVNLIKVDQPKESSTNKTEEEWSLGWLACKRYSANSVNPTTSHKNITNVIEDFLFEEINLNNGTRHERIKSKIFYLTSLSSFVLGIVLINHNIPLGGVLILTASPFFLLYPLIRFLFGGKGGLLPAIVTLVAQEYLKNKISNNFKKDRKR